MLCVRRRGKELIAETGELDIRKRVKGRGGGKDGGRKAGKDGGEGERRGGDRQGGM